MTDRKRLWVIILSGFAIIAIVLLAAGLSDFELLPGRRLPRREETADSVVWLPTPSGGDGFLYVVLFLLLQLLLPLSILYFLISREARKRVLRSLGLLLWLVAIYMVMRVRPDIFQQLQMEPKRTPGPDRLQAPTVEFIANPPPWLVWATAIGVALLIATGLVGGAWYIWRRRRPESPLEQLAQEAQDALEALHAGADLKNTILHCYFEMSRVLSEQRGLRRKEAMTPREFAARLYQTGLPDAQIEQLTRLFESVRYGAKVASEREEQQAVACLTAVVKACTSSP
ncbi:MAG: DUF4129 domain-containing protein [Anaerolineae bacterium]